MADPNAIFDSLRRFAGALTGGYGIGDVLHNLTEEMTQVLTLTGAGVTLVQDGRQRFVTAAIASIADLERVQEDHQSGPCIDAVAAASPVSVPDIAEGIPTNGGRSTSAWPSTAVSGPWRASP